MRQGFTSDRVGGLLWLLFGAAVVWGSWRMDRLEFLGINSLTAPGVVPGLIGVGFMAFSIVLLFRKPLTEEPAVEAPAEDFRRLGLSWLLCLLFAGVFLGRGAPFWGLAAAFVFLHILLLDDRGGSDRPSLLRRIAAAAAIAVPVAAAVTLIFEKLFLIRLP